jgi:UDP-N-acetylmuramoyl-L-alanyl-D-glutamate--2,6-diaminopimelate ligase
VINIDDAFGERLSRESKAPVHLPYGLGQAAKVRASRLQMDKDGTTMVVEVPEDTFSCRLPLIGRHNVYNALAAVGAAVALKIGTPGLKRALNTMDPVPGRLERVCAGRPFGIYVDYAHTDDALRNVLSTLRELTRGRVLLAFGCGGNRDTGKRFKMGRVAAEMADYTIITSDNPRKESPALIASQIEEGFRSVPGRESRYQIELNRRRAIEEIIRMAGEGDSVLIAGKGHETYQEFEDTVIPFDDRVYAREAIDLLEGRTPERETASRH